MADAEILAEYADVSILVVRQSTASVRMINDTIDMLEDSNSELLGCIYNDVKTRVFSGKKVFGGYGYGGYKYGYGRYGYGKYGYGNYGYGKRERKRYVKPRSEAPVEELDLYEE
jgi:Mrp family chromosome partitioning ATPase